jgi:hypothetical protein
MIYYYIHIISINIKWYIQLVQDTFTIVGIYLKNETYNFHQLEVKYLTLIR